MLTLTSMNAGLKLKTEPLVLMGVDLTGSMKPILQMTALLFLIFFVPEPLVLTDWFIRWRVSPNNAWQEVIVAATREGGTDVNTYKTYRGTPWIFGWSSKQSLSLTLKMQKNLFDISNSSTRSVSTKQVLLTVTLWFSSFQKAQWLKLLSDNRASKPSDLKPRLVRYDPATPWAWWLGGCHWGRWDCYSTRWYWNLACW